MIDKEVLAVLMEKKCFDIVDHIDPLAALWTDRLNRLNAETIDERYLAEKCAQVFGATLLLQMAAMGLDKELVQESADAATRMFTQLKDEMEADVDANTIPKVDGVQ